MYSITTRLKAKIPKIRYTESTLLVDESRVPFWRTLSKEQRLYNVLSFHSKCSIMIGLIKKGLLSRYSPYIWDTNIISPPHIVSVNHTSFN